MYLCACIERRGLDGKIFTENAYKHFTKIEMAGVSNVKTL